MTRAGASTVVETGTLPRLSDAIEFALQRVAPGDAAHWEAAAVLVVGPAVFVDGARPFLG